MFDYINNGLPKSFNGTFDYIYARENTYVTRQRYMFDLPRTKSRFVDKLPLFNFPNIWNKNLSNFNFKTSRKCYKRTIKSTFLDSYKVNVICNNPFCLDCHNVWLYLYDMITRSLVLGLFQCSFLSSSISPRTPAIGMYVGGHQLSSLYKNHLLNI